MSKITGRIFGEGFALRVVSGMLHNGNLIISWATGERAIGQLDYGYDSSVPYRTPVEYLEPGEPGYNPDQPMPLYERYHYRAFPTTYVDTEHYFRVRARNIAGRTLISPIYSVYVPEKMVIQSSVGSLHVAIRSIDPTIEGIATNAPSTLIDSLSIDPDASDSISIEGKALIQPVNDGTASDQQTTTIGTNPTLKVE
jgi:hypothetical protein